MTRLSLMTRLKLWLINRYWMLIDALHAPYRQRHRSAAFRDMLPAFAERVNELPAPVILEIGSRNVTGANPRAHFTAPGRYIGCDIHPGPNVDVVVDAHRLSDVIAPSSVDVVVSFSVFEHLLFPWKVVLEINRILKPGGLVFIATHPAWPAHELPWDFWRFPVGGLAHLFGEATGFRLIEAAEGVPCKIYSLESGERGFVFSQVNAGVAIVAEKVSDYDSEKLRWDIDLTQVLTTEYPRA